MNFARILDKWENLTPENRVYDKDNTESSEATVAQNRKRNSENRSKLLRKKPDATIDLHGLNADEAWTALQCFFQESRQKGMEKIHIVHGKGNHSALDSSHAGALRDLSRRFIESCPFAGESGYNSAREGGSGATWVLIK